MSLLSLGTQSLQANLTALNVTGQNISNVNTEGYTRQRPEFQSRENQNGVLVQDIERIADNFINQQIRVDSASLNSAEALEGFANELDNLLASNVTSVSSAIDDYFAALQGAVDDPVSLPSRELFLAQIEALVQRFNDLDNNIRRQNDTINGRLENSVSAINTLATNIAQINADIARGSAAGTVSNELLDQRDARLEELSTYVGFTSIEQSTGEVSVFIGNGQPLVVGLSTSTVTTVLSPADTSQFNIAIQNGDRLADITNQIAGGRVGGTLDYRNDILGSSLDELGRIAVVFAETMNEQHQRGADLDGNAGGLLFTDINSAAAITNRVLSERDNVTPASGIVRIDDTQALQASEYSLDFTENGDFILERASDGQRFTNLSLTPETAATDVDQDGEFFFDNINGDLTIRIDGFTLTLDASGPFSNGDGYLIRPTRNGAAEIDNVLNQPRLLALATPLAVAEDISNTGTAEASVSITEIDFATRAAAPGEITPPFNVSFLSELEVVGAAGNAGAASNVQIADFDAFAQVRYPLTITEDGAGNFNVTDSATPANTATGVALGTPAGTPATQLNLAANFGITLDITGVVAGSGESFTVQHDSSTTASLFQLVDDEGDRQVGQFVPGQSIQLQGFELTIQNNPAINDNFRVNLNPGGVSDNRNALLLSNLQSAQTIQGTTYQRNYGQTVERVGSQAAVAQINVQASRSVLESNQAQRSSVAGVNLDEEAARLVQFQQAYQASARLIQTSQTIFDALLQSV